MSSLVCVSDYEKEASRRLPKSIYDYYRSGSDEEITLRDNIEVFKSYLIIPRMLRDVSYRNLETTVTGGLIKMPICVAPTASQRMAHNLGEIAVAKASESLKTVMMCSTISTTSLEDIAKATPNGIKWFQLYIYTDRNETLKLIRRVESAKIYSALILTVDTPVVGKKRDDERNHVSTPSHLTMANFPTHTTADEQQSSSTSSGLASYFQSLFDSALTWDDVDWLKSVTYLPIFLKGILTLADGQLAYEHGCQGIIVSNHGGRQLDSTLPTLTALSHIAPKLSSKLEIYMDGGIRTGNDVFKALALGAKAVFLGRPVLWGLAVAVGLLGEKGVADVLGILRDELSQTMALAGCRSIKEINRNMIKHRSEIANL